jgi:hypothetical protein
MPFENWRVSRTSSCMSDKLGKVRPVSVKSVLKHGEKRAGPRYDVTPS